MTIGGYGGGGGEVASTPKVRYLGGGGGGSGTTSGFTCTIRWGSDAYVGHMRAVPTSVAPDTSPQEQNTTRIVDAPSVPEPKLTVPAHTTSPNLSLLEREIANLRADRALMTSDAIDDRLAQIHARLKAELR